MPDSGQDFLYGLQQREFICYTRPVRLHTWQAVSYQA